jgi:hypothetical protein
MKQSITPANAFRIIQKDDFDGRFGKSSFWAMSKMRFWNTVAAGPLRSPAALL